MKKQPLIEALAHVLADTYVLAVKAHGHHWNVTGPLFAPLHDFFGKQYESLLLAADELAERMRALGAPAPAGMEALLALSSIKRGGRVVSANDMIADMIAAHKATRKTVEQAKALAVKDEDTVTDDMLIERLTDHDKTLWMLQAQLA
jgi:starvation-inducible DNA-binding protein